MRYTTFWLKYIEPKITTSQTAARQPTAMTSSIALLPDKTLILIRA